MKLNAFAEAGFVTCPISVANFLICAGAVLLAVNLLQLAGTWNLIMKKQTIA